jgi:Flp pilus assembly protein TadG
MTTEISGTKYKDFTVTAKADPGGTPDGGVPDAGGADAGAPDAGSPDAGAPDAGPPPGGVLFFDDFNRFATDLGPAWSVSRGAWIDDGRANADLPGVDQAAVLGLKCADCSVRARVVAYGMATAALDLRESSGNDRYDLLLLANGRIQIRRHNGTATTVLGEAASGIADLTEWATLSLSAAGAGPVQLVASVNGVVKLSVTDSSSSAIVAAGTAGMTTDRSGTKYLDFTVTGSSSSGGTPDAGTPDAGTPDAGTPDAGTPDAGTPDAGTPDAGPPSGVLFFDDFKRTNASDLGPRWTILEGLWRDNDKANSDLNALDRAKAAGISCADCRIDARMVNFGRGDALLELRGGSGNRYALALRADLWVEIRRYDGGNVTVLGSAPTAIGPNNEWNRYAFAVQGAGPVTLMASVNGIQKLSVTDSSSSALTGSGSAGIAAGTSGIFFDDFKLSGVP